MASAVGHPLHVGALGEGEPLSALDALRLAVLHGQAGNPGALLGEVLAPKPTYGPLGARSHFVAAPST